MSFPFVQFEFAFPLGPADGRYLRRVEAGGEAERVMVLRTVGAPQRRRFRRRRPRRVDRAEPAAVPTVRATVIRPAEFVSDDDADGWLARMRRDGEQRELEVADAARALNFMLRAHRAAAADPYVRDVVAEAATVVRVGYGSGEHVADGRFDAAYELPARPQRRPRRAELLQPQERLAATLSARQSLLPAEELVLRARGDLEAHRPREAALQARIALEALLAELADAPVGQSAAIEARRPSVAAAANAALEGDPPGELSAAVEAAVAEMERTLRRVVLARATPRSP